MDGPVVTSAKRALEKEDVKEVLPWIPEDGEEEVREAFEKTLTVRETGEEAKKLADYWFYETCVRIHRMGEDGHYNGIKPAGQEVSPAVKAADESLEDGSVQELVELLKNSVEEGVNEKYKKVRERKEKADESVEASRKWVRSYVEYIHFAKAIYDVTQGKHEHVEFE